MDPSRKVSTIYARGSHGPATSELSLRRRSSRVLVVDDNPNTMRLMEELLSSRGYDVVALLDAAQAEAEILRRAPDLVLSDVVMPGKSGYELCRELKENPATRLIPFVLITGLTEREDRVRGIEAGADDFLSKPIFPEELFARVKSLLKLKEFTDELETAESVLCTLGLSVHLQLEEDEIIALRRGGYLHDLGKIAVPDEILKKGANLTSEEWVVMKRHPVTGENICRPLKSLRLVLPIIRNHHEHFDGTGYPDALAGQSIPRLARILQVVDVYDALRTTRPYKPALSHDHAAITMREEAHAGLWDEELVVEFFSMLDKQRQVA